MSGKIEMKIREGRSSDPKFESYAEWYLEATDENNKYKVKFSPIYSDMIRLVKQIIIHECKNNVVRKRKDDAVKKLKSFVSNIFDAYIQGTSLKEENIEDIYFKYNKRKK